MNNTFKLLLITLVSLFLVTKAFTPFLSKSFLGGFEYRVPIDVKYTGSQNNLNGYILLSINTEDLVNQGKLAYDCSDLRFEQGDSGQESPYFILSDCPSRNTRIAVAVSNLQPNQVTRLYMYYKSTQPISIPIYQVAMGSLKKPNYDPQATNLANWNSISGRRYFDWRSRFSYTFGNPDLYYQRQRHVLYINPGEETYHIRDFDIWVKSEIIDDYTFRYTVIPMTNYNNQPITLVFSGNLAYNRVYAKQETVHIYGHDFKYYIFDDDRNFRYNYGRPQVRILIVPGNEDDINKVYEYHSGRFVRIQFNGGKLPVQFLITVGDFQDENTYKQYIQSIFSGAYIPNRIVPPSDIQIFTGPEQSIASLFDITINEPTKGRAYYTQELPYNISYDIIITPPGPSNITVYIDNDIVYSGIISNTTQITGQHEVDYYGRHLLTIYYDGIRIKKVPFFVYKETISVDLEAPPIYGVDGQQVTIYAYTNKPLDSAYYYVFRLDGSMVVSGTMTNMGTYAQAFTTLPEGQYKVKILLTIDNETYVLWTYADILSQYTMSDVINKIDQLNQTFMNFYFDWQEFSSNTEEYLQEILSNISVMLSKQDLTLDQLYDIYTLLQDVYSAQQQLGIDLQNVNQTLYNQLQQTESNLNTLINDKAQEILARIDYLSQQQNITYDELVEMRQDLQLLQLMVQNNTDLINQYGTDILDQISQTNQTLYNLIQIKAQEILNELDRTQQNLAYLNQTLLDFAEQYNIDKTLVLQYLADISEQVNYTREQVELLQPIRDDVQQISYTLDQLYDQLLNYWMPQLNDTIITKTNEIKQMLQEMNVTNQEIYNELDSLIQLTQDIYNTVNQSASTLDDINAQLENLNTILDRLSEMNDKIDSIYDIVRDTNANTEEILRILQDMQQQINNMQSDLQQVKNATVQTTIQTQGGTQATIPGTQSIVQSIRENTGLLAALAIVGLIVLGVTVL